MDSEDQKPRSNGFTLRVRLGDVLTMVMVLLAAVGIMIQIQIGLGSVNAAYVELIQRLVKVETKLEDLGPNQKR